MRKLWLAAVSGILLSAAAVSAGTEAPVSDPGRGLGGQVTLAAAVDKRMETFFAADISRDGVLDKGEFGEMLDAAMARLGVSPTEPSRGQVDPFTFADSDADGRVTEAEFRRVTARVIKAMDKDGDGLITLQTNAGN